MNIETKTQGIVIDALTRARLRTVCAFALRYRASQLEALRVRLSPARDASGAPGVHCRVLAVLRDGNVSISAGRGASACQAVEEASQQIEVALHRAPRQGGVWTPEEPLAA